MTRPAEPLTGSVSDQDKADAIGWLANWFGEKRAWDDEDVESLARVISIATARLGARATEVEKDVATLLDGFDKGFFVRNADKDVQPDWAVKLLPYLLAMARLAKLPERRLIHLNATRDEGKGEK